MAAQTRDIWEGDVQTVRVAVRVLAEPCLCCDFSWLLNRLLTVWVTFCLAVSSPVSQRESG